MIARLLQRIALIATVALTSTAAVHAQTTPAPAAPSSTWEQVQKNKVLRIGVVVAPPWFLKKPDGAWSGMGVSVSQAAANGLGVKLEFVETTFGNAVAALQANQIDMMPMLDPTPARAAAVSFPGNPLYYQTLGILVQSDASIKLWSELNNGKFRIGVAQGAAPDQFITANFPKATILRFPGNPEVLAAFQSKRVDGISLFHPALVNASNNMKLGKIVIPTPLRSSIGSIATRKELDMRFINYLDSSISFWYANQEVQRWYEAALTEQGIDITTSPPVQRELMP